MRAVDVWVWFLSVKAEAARESSGWRIWQEAQLQWWMSWISVRERGKGRDGRGRTLMAIHHRETMSSSQEIFIQDIEIR